MMCRRRAQSVRERQSRSASRAIADSAGSAPGRIVRSFRASCISDRRCSRRSSRLVWSRMNSNRSDNMRILWRSALRAASFTWKVTIRHIAQPITMPPFTCARVRGTAQSAVQERVPRVPRSGELRDTSTSRRRPIERLIRKAGGPKRAPGREASGRAERVSS